MSEMTVTEHNEQLILQKQQLLAQFHAQQQEIGSIVGAAMRQTKRKTLHLTSDNLATLPGVHMTRNEDGSIDVRFIKDEELASMNGAAPGS